MKRLLVLVLPLVCVIAAEPKELTIVHIAGTISIEDLRDLRGQFGIPRGIDLGPQGGRRGNRNDKEDDR